jgi:hypothetical protein
MLLHAFWMDMSDCFTFWLLYPRREEPLKLVWIWWQREDSVWHLCYAFALGLCASCTELITVLEHRSRLCSSSVCTCVTLCELALNWGVLKRNVNTADMHFSRLQFFFRSIAKMCVTMPYRTEANLCSLSKLNRRTRWPRGLRHALFSLTRTLGSWARIPLEAWMSVFILCLY